MIDLTKIDWRNPPSAAEMEKARMLFVEWLVSRGHKREVVTNMPASAFGLIAAARLIQMGAVLATQAPVTDAARYLATVAYNADQDMERTMSANEKPFDAITYPVEGYLASLVQSLIDGQPTAPTPAPSFDKAQALDLLTRLRAVIEGAK